MMPTSPHTLDKEHMKKQRDEERQKKKAVTPVNTERDLNVAFRANRTDYTEDLTIELSVNPDPESVTLALSQLPTQIAFWSLMESALKKEIAETEARRDLLYAEAFERQQQRLEALEAEKEKKERVTLDRVKSAVARVPALLKIEERLRKLQGQLGDVEVGRKAVFAKKDCAIELARMLRAEMELSGAIEPRARTAKQAERRLRRQIEEDE